MNIGTLLDADNGAVLVATVYRTTTPWERMRGLLGRAPLGTDEGLLIDPCGAVHTFMMRYAIDLVYLSTDLVVTKIVPSVPPSRCSMAFGSAKTLELAAGFAANCGLRRGQGLRWQPQDQT